MDEAAVGSAAPQRLVELRDVTKAYEEGNQRHVILESVALSVDGGSMTAVLGRSGTGKSTLLNLISGIDLPDSGEIIVDGKAINRLSEQDRTLFRRRNVGFVFQFFNLIPTLTVEENLILPLELNATAGNSYYARVIELLGSVGLAERAGSFPDRLSGGEQQRVAIARALIHDPLLLLADEPTGNLDLDTGRQVLDLIDRLARERGKTLIIATHSREVAARADRVLRIRDHRLVDADAGEL